VGNSSFAADGSSQTEDGRNASGLPRHGYRTARTELGEAVLPHAVDAALAAYRDEGRRLAAAARAAELVERALRGDAL
jgi:hypothetical protein